MRTRRTGPFLTALFSLSLFVPTPVRASQRTVILALDQSASMVRSDPGKLRVEAAGLMAATEDSKDLVGIIAFGDTARWLQQPIERDRFDFTVLDKVGSSDAHTSFSPVLATVEKYLAAQPSSFFQANEISLVLLTDGRSDPADKLADQDRSASLSIASQNAPRLRLYTIGLGGDLDRDFLQHLARTSNGLAIHAASATDLPDAFLQVAARTAALPVYVRNSTPKTLQWAGTPQRVVAVFTGDQGALTQLDGKVLYRSGHVAVAEEDPSQGHARLQWSGHGSEFLCIQQPLRMLPEGEFPSTLLTDAPRPAAFTLESQQGPLKDAFFLQSARGSIRLAGLDSETIPLRQQDSGGRFIGELEAKSAGNFRARAFLDSPYGRVETYLGDLTVSVLPVEIPQQVSDGIFDPLPRSWFAKKLMVQSLLPVGTVHVDFFPQGHAASSDQVPKSLNVAPGQSAPLKMVLNGDDSPVHVVDYSATWNDGLTEVSRHGVLRVLVRQMSPVELLRDKWQWVAAFLLLSFTAIGAAWKFWPRPLQADLIVRQNGTQVLRLQLPSQLRTRTLHVSESEAGKSSGSTTAVIHGQQSRELLSLESTRRRGRWTIVARPRAAHAPAHHGRKWAEIDLRTVHVPVFSTEDGTIQINVLYS